jgi:hypothetical protein
VAEAVGLDDEGVVRIDTYYKAIPLHRIGEQPDKVEHHHESNCGGLVKNQRDIRDKQASQLPIVKQLIQTPGFEEKRRV